MQQVGDVDQIEGAAGKRRAVRGPVGVEHVQSPGWQHVGCAGLLGPAANGRKVGVGAVAGLPGPAGQGTGKVRGVLAGAAGDFERLAAGRQQGAQHGQDGVAVAFGGGAVGQGVVG